MPFSLFAADTADHKRVEFHPRVLGSAAPMFPGYEVDICDHVDDDQKPDAVWHRERARQIGNAKTLEQQFDNQDHRNKELLATN